MHIEDPAHSATPQPRSAPAVLQIADAMEIANRAVLEDIESYAVKVTLEGQTWYDTRPMLDPREHAPEALDMAAQALRYAEKAGLMSRHRAERHLVRLVPVHPEPGAKKA